MSALEAAIPFGRYELIERIGHGGMAEIYKARLRGPGGFEKILAIKRLLPFWSQNAEFVAMLVDEAKLLTHLFHPNIVHVYELGIENGEVYITMEYVHGLNVKQCLLSSKDRAEGLPLPVALSLVRDVLKGLDYAHTRKTREGDALQFVHRDVSPQNILVTSEGAVKLTDFGIAKAIGRSSEHTQTGVLKGKFAYMSPEQARGRAIDARSDLFSVGLILFECLTGERYFRGKTDLAVLEEIKEHTLDKMFACLQDRAPQLANTVRDIFGCALTPEVDRRYASAAEFTRDIEVLLSDEGFDDSEFGTPAECALYLANHVERAIDRQSAVDASAQDDTRSHTPAPKTLILAMGENDDSLVRANDDSPLQNPIHSDGGVNVPFVGAQHAVPVQDPIDSAVDVDPSSVGAHGRAPLNIIAIAASLLLVAGFLWPRLVTSPSAVATRASAAHVSAAHEGAVYTAVPLEPAPSETLPNALAKSETAVEESSALPVAPSEGEPVVPESTVEVKKIPPATGKLFVNVKPWAQLAIAGLANGLETPLSRQLPVGEYTLVATHNGDTLKVRARVEKGRSTHCVGSFSDGEKGFVCR